jgi:hypothetical protein
VIIDVNELRQTLRRFKGEDDFDNTGGTIPQRLLLMNGNMVTDNTEAAIRSMGRQHSHQHALAGQQDTPLKAAYLADLHPQTLTAMESAHFDRPARQHQVHPTHAAAPMSDLYWTLMNATEFSWNH